MTVTDRLPLPPLEMRQLVGPTDPAAFDNPTGAPVYPHLPPEAYDSVLDFGCGCGRVARQLIQQDPRPKTYLGIDLHRGMVEWCRTNLAPAAPGFTFLHHDVFNVTFNPGPDKPRTLPFPADDDSFTLVHAWSVFTHLVQSQAEHYLHEAARALAPGGTLLATWLFFDRANFPTLRDFQAAVYTHELDPTAAVYYDREWVRQTAADAGLTIFSVVLPKVRNFQWTLGFTPSRPGIDEAEFPPDTAPVASAQPPPMPLDPASIGLGG